jgi:hypothetical protein
MHDTRRPSSLATASQEPASSSFEEFDSRAIQLLVVDRNLERGRALTRGLDCAFQQVVVAPDALCNALENGREGFDVIVSVVDADSLDALALICQRHGSLGYPELVFVVDHWWQPEAQALRSAGLERILWAHRAPAWLAAAVPSLAGLARANRLRVAAMTQIPALPEEAFNWPPRQIATLPQAESRYREAFLRLLLTTEGSRRAAAQRAGVPYRSFCQMLRKLGIDPAEGSSEQAHARGNKTDW